MRIAIHRNDDIFYHSTQWSYEWEKYCQENKIEYDIIDCFSNDFINQIGNYDILLWHFSQYSLQEMLFARNLLAIAESLGVRTFPNVNTSWHFDDKIAESYLLKSIEAPIPDYNVFYSKKRALEYLDKKAEFPLVAKLRCGSGSSNVVMLKNKNQAIKYVGKMFGKGIDSYPNVMFKTKSNLSTSRNLKTLISRMKRIPDFIESVRKAKAFPSERGYVYLQEFISNDGYDLKVVVVGNKLSFLARNVRKNDFRASGGGTLIYDKSLINSEIRRIAFDLNEKLGFQCMGYDFVVDNRNGKPKIVEISYGFSHTAQLALGGHWDINDIWKDEPLNAPEEVLKNMVRGVQRRKDAK